LLTVVRMDGGTALGWLAAYPYVIVLVGAAIDATGLPFPGRVLLVAAGALAAGQPVSLAALVVVGAAGAVAGDHLWYFAGRLGSQRLLRTYCALSVSSGRCERTTTDYFRRFGPLTIVIGRYVAGVRLLAWPLAARSGVRYPTFLVLDVAGALLWSATWVLLGWFFADRWQAVAEHAGTVLAAAVGASLVLGAGVAVFRLWRRRSHGPALRGSEHAAG
jgi:membrane protein DedA with SNARE-associated domain